MKALPVLVLLALALLAVASSHSGEHSKRTLVLLESLSEKSTYSKFFGELSARGFDLQFAQAEDTTDVVEYGDYLYDNIIVFAPKTDAFASLDARGLLKFVDHGGNVLIAADATASAAVRQVASHVGLKFADPNQDVVDHFHYAPADDGDHTLVVADRFLRAPVVWGGEAPRPVVFRGTALRAQADNELVLPLLRAHATAYTAPASTKKGKEPRLSVYGSEVVLAGALQARNNARVTVVASLDIFADEAAELEYAAGSVSGNADFVQDLVAWTFKERGVLRASNVRHNRANETAGQGVYRVSEEIEYHIDLHEWDGARGAWTPYQGTDVMLDFVMLDPYVRTGLAHDGRGHFAAAFSTPDVYGVFQFKVEYSRAGYTYVRQADTVTVRPFRHNEYERFIGSASPYYFAAFSLMGMFGLFSLLFLCSKPAKSVKPE